MSQSESQIAIIIDADNISYKQVPQILQKVKAYGTAVLKLAYGDWKATHLKKWQEVAKQHQFTLEFAKAGNNSTDMRIAVGVGQLLIKRPDIDIFCLATHDSDFLSVCDVIRENHKKVIGIGSNNASKVLIQACNAFVFLADENLDVKSTAKKQIQASSPPTVQPISQESPANPKATAPEPAKTKAQSVPKAAAPKSPTPEPAKNKTTAMLPVKDRPSGSQPSPLELWHAAKNLTVISGGKYPESKQAEESKKPVEQDNSAKRDQEKQLLTQPLVDAFALSKEEWLSIDKLRLYLYQIEPSINYSSQILLELLRKKTKVVEIKQNQFGFFVRLRKN